MLSHAGRLTLISSQHSDSSERRLSLALLTMRLSSSSSESLEPSTRKSLRSRRESRQAAVMGARYTERSMRQACWCLLIGGYRGRLRAHPPPSESESLLLLLPEESESESEPEPDSEPDLDSEPESSSSSSSVSASQNLDAWGSSPACHHAVPHASGAKPSSPSCKDLVSAAGSSCSPNAEKAGECGAEVGFNSFS